MMGAGCRWITDTAGIGHCRDSGMQMMATACGPSSSRSGSSPGNVSPGPGLAAANPNQRAALVVRAEELALQQLPWIPDVQPDMVLVLGKSLSGSVSSSTYLFSLWADHLGGTG